MLSPFTGSLKLLNLFASVASLAIWITVFGAPSIIDAASSELKSSGYNTHASGLAQRNEDKPDIPLKIQFGPIQKNMIRATVSIGSQALNLVKHDGEETWVFTQDTECFKGIKGMQTPGPRITCSTETMYIPGGTFHRTDIEVRAGYPDGDLLFGYMGYDTLEMGGVVVPDFEFLVAEKAILFENIAESGPDYNGAMGLKYAPHDKDSVQGIHFGSDEKEL